MCPFLLAVTNLLDATIMAHLNAKSKDDLYMGNIRQIFTHRNHRIGYFYE